MSEFVDRAIERIGNIPDANDIPSVIRCLKQLEERGFTLDDAIRFTRCTEEVNPELNEELALSRMRKIEEKYPDGMKKSKS